MSEHEIRVLKMVSTFVESYFPALRESSSQHNSDWLHPGGATRIVYYDKSLSSEVILQLEKKRQEKPRRQ